MLKPESATFSLFDDSFRRKLSQTRPSRTSNVEVTRQLQRQVSECVCPVNTEPTQPDAPTEQEFLVDYDKAVTELRAKGTLVNVEGVQDIT